MNDSIKSISDFLYYFTKKYADYNLFVYRTARGKETVTYSGFRNAAEKCALSYERKGYSGGKRIALLGENSYEWILNFFAIELTGNVAVLLDKAQKPDFLKQLAKRMDIDCIVHSDEYEEEAKTIAQLQGVERFPMKEITAGDVEGIFQRKAIPGDQEAVIAFTSGTTGISKGVVLSQYAFICNTLAGAESFTCSGNTVLVLPLHHMFGLNAHTLSAMIYGACIHINSSLRYLSQDLEEAQPEFLMMTPLVMERILKVLQKMKAAKHPVPSRIVSGGAPVNADLCESYAELGVQIYNVYGCTESATFITISDVPVTAGKTDMKCFAPVQIDNPDEGGCGEILIGAPGIMKEYYRMPEETSKALADGWFHTGDIGFLENDMLTITGRMKNLIILPNGENIAPEELEAGLQNLPRVKEVIVKQAGHDLVAEVYPENAENFTDADQHELRNSILEFTKGYPAYKRITKVEVRKLPFEKTNTMKIRR